MTQIGRKMALFYMILKCIGFGGGAMALATDEAFIARGKEISLSADPAADPAAAPAPANKGNENVEDRGKGGNPDRMIRSVDEPTLTVFLPEKRDANRAAVIVCPGGGYAGLAIDKEGYAIAETFNEKGVAALVLKYRLPAGKPPAPEGTVPAPIQDVQKAIRIARARATEWNIDPTRLGVMGFSAGGHVASTAATQFDDGDPSASYDPVARQSSRPDFAILMYPVVSMADAPAHKGSRKNLLGESPSPKMIEKYSAELHVTKKTPPLFIVHAKDDKGVIVENSTKLAEAAKKAGVPHELVLFETGGHGFGLGKPGSEAAVWFDRLMTWMQAQKFVAGK